MPEPSQMVNHEEQTDALPKRERTSHDLLWKEFMERFLEPFLWLFFPRQAAKMDFRTLTFLNKEQVINIPKQKLRITDIVAEVKTLTGVVEAIIIHIDAEARDKRTMGQRMFEYYGLHRLLLQKPVFPIVLLLLPDEVRLGWKRYKEMLWGRKIVEFKYAQVGLRSLDSIEYLQKDDPIAAALAALMKHKEEEKASVKLTSLQTVASSHLMLEDKLFLLNLIETYLPMDAISSEDTEEEIMQELVKFEMTWQERIELKAREEGREAGREEGLEKGRLVERQNSLIYLMKLKFGEIPETKINDIKAITDYGIFDILYEQVLFVPSLDKMSIPSSDRQSKELEQST